MAPSAPTTRSGAPVPERILLFGDSDAGKTYSFLTVAKWHQRRGSKAHFYGITSPGNEWDLFFLPGAEFEDLDNVTFFSAQEAQDWFDIYDKKIAPRAKPHDWLCLDVIGDIWEAVKNEYAQKELGSTDLGSAWMVDGTEKYPVEGWEWGRPNARYAAFAQNRVLRFPGHVMALAWEQQLQEESKTTGKGGEKQQVKEVFGLINRKPRGQKLDYARFRTILHLGKNPKGEWVMRTARDKQRQRVGEIITRGNNTTYKPAKVRDFFLDYLKPIGGWSL